MRRKSSQNNYGGHRKNRHGGGGGGGHNRPRRNFSSAREKYLAQARDALAAGDRVLAENFLQHADHCWRMMLEEGSARSQPQPGKHVPNAAASPHNDELATEDELASGNANQLPAFLTNPYMQPKTAEAVDPATIQNWEERDA